MEHIHAYRCIDKELAAVDGVVKQQLQRICKDGEFIELVFRTFFQSQGKKLRPSLAILSGFALRQDNLHDARFAAQYDALIATAAVTELVHSASLMHDDVLDGAATRRGHQSLNAQFGTKVAILAGDILYSQAFELLLEHSDKDVIIDLTQCVRRMCHGEILNLSEHDFETYKMLIADKTASLMNFCCKAGTAVVQHADDSTDVVSALQGFGYDFGMMFQLADDLSDNDSAVAIANKSSTIALLHTHIQSAERALNVVPDSIYKAGLAHLLHDVVAKSEPLTAVNSVPAAHAPMSAISGKVAAPF